MTCRPVDVKLWAMLENFTLITGPCAAESFTQLYETAKLLKNTTNINQNFIFRTGVWKPRTRPGQFQGAGHVALHWLDIIHDSFSLPIAVEVGLPEHIEQVLKHKIEYIWFGARTTSSPFLMESMACALKGTNLKVIIKNPINPEFNLWAGAVERILLADINPKNIMLVHRGFSTYYNSKFRYAPFWDIALMMRKEFQLPLLCDPGHISGRKDLILEICLQAINLKYQGLMIESHYMPDMALSDAKQQILPAELSILLSKLELQEIQYNLGNFERTMWTKENSLREMMKEINFELDNSCLDYDQHSSHHLQ